jgi:Arc/MetJ-type ribon-helix-helix transcriptional regulator
MAKEIPDAKIEISMPSSWLAEIQTAAEEEQRGRDDLVREAIERYLKERRWQRLLAYGEQKARSLGLTEADVPRLIEEYRLEQRQGHS